jgi:hypothetical protein
MLEWPSSETRYVDMLWFLVVGISAMANCVIYPIARQHRLRRTTAYKSRQTNEIRH